jgi:hypothetical protein
MQFTYEIIARSVDVGGGWLLRLLENGEEVGSGAFPPTDEFEDAEEALRGAYEDAEWKAYVWLESRPLPSKEHSQRQAAVDFATANLMLSGLTPSVIWQKHAQRYIDGEIDLDAFIQGPDEHTKEM